MTGAAFGFLGHIGIAKETNWGTAVAADDYIEAMSESLQAAIDRFPVVNINAQFGEPSDEAGVKRVTGDISANGNPLWLGYLLKGALNTSSITEVASGVLWTTTFLTNTAKFSADAPVAPYTFEVFRDVTTSFQYAGCCIDTLTLNFQPNQDVRATASFIGKSEARISATTPTFVSSPDSPFIFDTASIQIGGSANAKLEALTVEIANNLEGVPRLNGTDEIAGIRMTDYQMVNISGTFEFSDINEYNDFMSQTERQLEVYLTKASSFSLHIDVPKMVYTAFPLETGGRERNTVDFEGKGFYHAGSGTAIQIDLTTVKSDY